MSEKYSMYQSHFNQKVNDIKGGPVEERSVVDKCCFGTFLVLFLATIGGGIYFIIEGNDFIDDMLSVEINSPTALGSIIAHYAGYVVGMMALSVALSIIFVLLCKAFPACMVYGMMVFSFLVYIGLIALGFLTLNYALAIVFIAVLLINALILYCYQSYITIGIRLLGCAGRFIAEKPAVYLITLICFVLNALFTTFWIFGWLGAYSVAIVESSQSGDTTFLILTYVWYALAVFFGFFLYYCMVFLVASACAYWYYQSENNSIMRGFNNVKYNLGAITFGAIVITIVTMLRILASSGRQSSGVMACVAACVRCVLSCIEEIVKALNHNAVIVMAVTNQGYIDSAKSAVGLIFDNFGLFMIVDFFTEFMEIYEIIICVLVPAVLGGGLIYMIEANLIAAIWGGVAILLLASIVSSVIIGMLDEALSCIFIFYCFDKKFHEMGLTVNNIPEEIKTLFNQESGAALEATEMHLQ